MTILVGNKYILSEKINEGAFGKIFLGYHKESKEEIIIKIENQDETNLLLHEARIYNFLKNTKGIPKLRSFGSEGKYAYLILDKLYKSLEELKNLCSLILVIKIAIEMINRLEILHNKNIIHRDIKPENFMISTKDNIIYLIDFGLSKLYKENGKHIKFKESNTLIGTARYASINNHKGYEYSRRDDLESLGYIFIYLLNRKLPWQGLKISSNKKKFEKIGQIKEETSLDTLCDNIPHEFKEYLEYCRNLKFQEKPDYEFLKNIFNNLLKDKNIQNKTKEWFF